MFKLLGVLSLIVLVVYATHVPIKYDDLYKAYERAVEYEEAQLDVARQALREDILKYGVLNNCWGENSKIPVEYFDQLGVSSGQNGRICIPVEVKYMLAELVVKKTSKRLFYDQGISIRCEKIFRLFDFNTDIQFTNGTSCSVFGCDPIYLLTVSEIIE